MDNTLSDGKLSCESRMYGIDEWYYGARKDAKMRIPDEITRCVCFLSVRVPTENGLRDFFIGTGFLVAISEDEFDFVYLITAKHVIDASRREGYQTLYARLNTLDGGSRVIRLHFDWIYPENPAIDVAVLPLLPPPDVFEFTLLHGRTIATDESLAANHIGIGDDLFMVGLFNQRWGHQRNIPIMRTGIIASMPHEPFVEESGETYNAYLVEMRSIGGLSGSPVFVYFNRLRTMETAIDADEDWRFMLIGLIRGHWNLERQDTAVDAFEGEIDQLNTGIAQVTPIQDAMAIIYGERLSEMRKNAIKHLRQQHAPTLDVSLPKTPSPQTGNAGVTRQEFEEALRRASRKTSVPDEKAKGEES